MIFGWDGSSWQGIPKVKLMLLAGFLFVVEKITGEGNYVNLIWEMIRQACYDAGVKFGGYDWVEPHLMDGPDAGVFYANDFLRVFKPRPGDIVAVDFESPIWFTGPLGRNIEAAMRAYLFTLRDACGGRMLIYTAPYFLKETGADKWAWFNEANGFYLWQAAPGETGTLPDDAPWPGPPAPFTATLVHQFDWHRQLPAAIAGEFDVNRCEVTLDQLIATVGFRTDAPSTPVEEPMSVPVPAEGKYGVIVLPNGNTVVVMNFGGQTTPDGVVGVRIVDAGVSVKSATAPGVIDDRSFKDEAAQPWRERPAVQ